MHRTSGHYGQGCERLETIFVFVVAFAFVFVFVAGDCGLCGGKITSLDTRDIMDKGGWGGNRDMEARGLNEGMSVGQEEGANIPTVDHIRPPITPDYYPLYCRVYICLRKQNLLYAQEGAIIPTPSVRNTLDHQ